MLNDGTGFKRIYLATGYTDLRRGIEGLAAIIRFQFELDPYAGYEYSLWKLDRISMNCQRAM